MDILSSNQQNFSDWIVLRRLAHNEVANKTRTWIQNKIFFYEIVPIEQAVEQTNVTQVFTYGGLRAEHWASVSKNNQIKRIIKYQIIIILYDILTNFILTIK